MKISYNWLRDFVDFPQSPDELGEMLDKLGLEVEGMEDISAGWTNVLVGKVVACDQVPQSDHLSYCMVDAGVGETVPVVCGAPNVAAGQLVPLALVGAELPGGFRITERKLRGVLSRGMICSERELGISDEAAGIMALPDECRVGKPLDQYIRKQDWVFDLEITINRPDCLSHLGVAREIAASTGLDLVMPTVELTESDEPVSEWISVEILAPEKCPRYSARVVKGVDVHSSPLWMQERLRNVGVRPISNVVDVTNYVLMELGHPLHAFDYHLVADGRIIVRTAEVGEKFTTLDEKEHMLASSDLLIADPQGGIALAGVMGGMNSEIKEDTHDVLIECAYFNPVGIRETSRDRGISTESSHRFERGVDPEMTPYAAGRSAQLINELAGGESLRGIVDNYPKQWKPSLISLRPARANRLLATRIDGKRMAEYLVALGCKVKHNDTIEVETPSWRHDLEREIDLVEEIARLHGYDKIGTAIRSSVPLKVDPDRERDRIRIDQIKRSLVELGMREAISWSMIPSSEPERFPSERLPIRVINPLSEDTALMRYSLCPSLLRVVERNHRAGIEDVRLFEWGKCFWMEENNVREGWQLAGIFTGSVRPESWFDKTRSIEIYDLKGLIDGFTRKISLDMVKYICYDISAFLLYGGRVTVGERDSQDLLGVFGQIDPSVADRFGIEVPVWYFEFDGDSLLERTGSATRYRSIPRYPAALRDLAFIVDEGVQAGQLEEVIRRRGGDTLESVIMFDLFRGGVVSSGKKSLAFHLIFRSSARTLSDAEVDEIVAVIVSASEEAVGANLRAL